MAASKYRKQRSERSVSMASSLCFFANPKPAPNSREALPAMPAAPASSSQSRASGKSMVPVPISFLLLASVMLLEKRRRVCGYLATYQRLRFQLYRLTRFWGQKCSSIAKSAAAGEDYAIMAIDCRSLQPHDGGALEPPIPSIADTDRRCSFVEDSDLVALAVACRKGCYILRVGFVWRELPERTCSPRNARREACRNTRAARRSRCRCPQRWACTDRCRHRAGSRRDSPPAQVAEDSHPPIVRTQAYR